jgi:hypothetical protein
MAAGIVLVLGFVRADEPVIEAAIADLDLGGAVPRQLAANEYTGDFMFAADEGFNDQAEWLSSEIMSERPIAIGRVPMIRRKDGTWRPGYATHESCNDVGCRHVNLERGGFDSTGSLLATVVKLEGGIRAVWIGTRTDGRFLPFTSATAGVVGASALGRPASFIALSSTGIDVERLRIGAFRPVPSHTTTPNDPVDARRAAFAVSRDGRHAVVASGTGLAVAPMDAASQPRALESWSVPATTLAWSADGSLVAAGSAKGEIAVWGVTDGQLLWKRNVHDGQSVTGLEFDPRAQLLVSAGDDKRLIVVDARSGSAKMVYATKRPLRGVAIQPDSGAIATLEKASAMTKIGLGATSIGLHVILPAAHAALKALAPADRLSPTPGLDPEAETWSLMRICTRVLESAAKEKAKASATAKTVAEALKRSEFETVEEFEKRRAETEAKEEARQLGAELAQDEPAALGCVQAVGERVLEVAAVATLGPYDVERGQFPVTLDTLPPGPTFQCHGTLTIDRERARGLREASPAFPGVVRYRLVVPPLRAGEDSVGSVPYTPIAGIDRFGAVPVEIRISTDMASSQSQTVDIVDASPVATGRP